MRKEKSRKLKKTTATNMINYELMAYWPVKGGDMSPPFTVVLNCAQFSKKIQGKNFPDNSGLYDRMSPCQ